MMTPSYWTERARQNALKAQAMAGSASARERTLFAKAKRAIEAELNDLLLDIGDTPPTRTQLWQSLKFLRLRQAIEDQMRDVASHQIDILDEVLPQVFEEIVGRTMDEFNTSTPITKPQVQGVIDTAWSGSNYSTRIWHNMEATAQHLQKDMEDLIVLGKSPTKIKQQLARDLGVSYRKADRLVRTESAYLQNQASLQTYKAEGVRYVKYLHGGHASGKCDCEKYANQIFILGAEPTIPQHPNCICCYAPVVENKIQ